MLNSNVLSAIFLLLAADVGGLAVSQERGANSLTLAEFEKLHKQLQPPKDEAWRMLPWHNSILKARALASREKKPIYMLVRSGHPLGCV